jgi:hypothetical protein
MTRPRSTLVSLSDTAWYHVVHIQKGHPLIVGRKRTPTYCWPLIRAGPHEAGWLALETAKVRATLGLTPRWALTEAIQRTMAWYRAQQQGGDARALCHSDLRAYHAHEEEV